MKPDINGMRLQLLDRVHVIGETFDRNVSDDLTEWQDEYGDILPNFIVSKIIKIGQDMQDLYQAIGGLEEVES
jgi:hypothetical protein